MDDFIGCKYYDPGSKEKCNSFKLPGNLQGGKKELIDKMVGDVLQKNSFPPPLSWQFNKCLRLSVNYRGKHCSNAIHEYEAVKMNKISCNVRYYCFLPNDRSFMIVVGKGIHSHSLPTLTISSTKQKQIVSSLLEKNKNATTKDCSEEVLVKTGRQPSEETIRKLRSKYRITRHPHGVNLEALIQEVLDTLEYGCQPYVKDIYDNRLTNPTVGIVIIMNHDELLKKCVFKPQFGVDGTFNIVSKDEENYNMELLSVAAKDDFTGKVYSPFRALTSRKTKEARKVVFRELITRLVELGLKDPLLSSGNSRLSVTTDFETTFGVASFKRI